MARQKYKCPHEKCGNEIPAEKVDRKLRGSVAHVRLEVPVLCEGKAHDEDIAMERVEFTPPRREVRAD